MLLFIGGYIGAYIGILENKVDTTGIIRVEGCLLSKILPRSAASVT